MINKPILTSLSLLVSCAISSAYAQDTQSTDETSTVLDAIDVTETAFQDYVSTITSKKLDDMQASDVKDILKTMPSVTVDGASRYSQKVYIRGLEDKFSNITIDGARLTGELFHHSGDQTIDAEMLKIGSIELGPNSALSGPGVINGSFVYETKDPSDMLEDDATFGGRFALGYQTGFHRKQGSLALYGAPSQVFEYLISGNIVDDGKLETPNNDDITSKQSKLESGLAKIVINPSVDSSLSFTYNTYSDGGDRQLSGEKPGDDNTDNPYNEISRDTFSSKFEYNPDNDLINFTAKLYSNNQTLTRESLLENNRVRVNGIWVTDGQRQQPEREYINKVIGFDIRNSSLIGNHLFTYGVDGSHETQDKKTDGLAKYIGGSQDGETEDVSFAGEGKVSQYGIYIEDEMDFDRWVFNLGARFDKYKLGGVYEGSFSQVSPKAKVAFQATDNLKLRAGYGRIFRGPSLGETLMLSNGLTQSENTEAQTGHNFELGFDYDLSNTFGVDKSLFGFTAYRYNVDNYAHPTKNTSLSPQGEMEIWGLESVFTLRQDKLQLNLSHTYTDGEASDEESGAKFEPRTAKIHTFKVDTDYYLNDQWSFNYNAQFVPGNKYKTEDGKVERSGYGVHNVGVVYRPSALKGAKIDFGIDNVFDKEYTRHTAFGTYFGSEDSTAYEVGRNFKVRLSYKF